MENKPLCKLYPFLIPRNRWTGKVPEDYDYSYTELDAMPAGWREAFGIELCEEIKICLNKMKPDVAAKYMITQIKEKYGQLCWYTNFTTEDLEKVMRKYEDLSKRTCIVCGKPAEFITLGWISPYCGDCIKLKKESYKPIEKYFNKMKGE